MDSWPPPTGHNMTCQQTPIPSRVNLRSPEINLDEWIAPIDSGTQFVEIPSLASGASTDDTITPNAVPAGHVAFIRHIGVKAYPAVPADSILPNWTLRLNLTVSNTMAWSYGGGAGIDQLDTFPGVWLPARAQCRLIFRVDNFNATAIQVTTYLDWHLFSDPSDKFGKIIGKAPTIIVAEGSRTWT